MLKITSTFKHLDGIGDKKEFEIWRNGILNWDKYIDNQKRKSLFFDDNDLKLSIEALESCDVNFFADRLNKKDYFRLALSFPQNTMFLDIETTGLSFYYDHITMIGWVMNGEYDYYVSGVDKKEKFIKVLNKAKVIITFNGTRFDLPFIKQEFKDTIIFPKCHIDLMYMCRRLGLKGGQKIIENKINFKRPKGLQDKGGYEATIFWDKYKWGDKSSLVNLIKYNFYDIKGMTCIFDYCVKELYKREKYDRFFKIDMKFFKNFSKLDLKEIKNFVKQHDIPFDPKSILKFNDLKNKMKQDFKIIGVDLTGSEKKASGIALLQNNQVITELLKKDDEIVEFILKNNVGLVSIDSPLSLPKGRISVYDDSGRNKYGIMRECEKVLKRRGVNVYPTLIQSMQKLTKRGIELANRLRKHGIPVIESYPGVVQDIIGLPRKQVSLDLLKKGLKIFGLEGDFEKKDISHDEIDAITSALVGVFFLSKDFEAIGTIDENFMIIPDLKADKKEKIVYGISGEIASGKTTIAKYLENKGFKYIRYSQILSKLLRNQGKVVNRENLQKIGEEFYKNNQYELSKLVYNEIKDSDKIVIDGLRHLEDYTFWYEIFSSSFKLIYLEADINIRRKRFRH